MQQVEADVGSSVRMQVRANDVSIALDKPTASSIRIFYRLALSRLSTNSRVKKCLAQVGARATLLLVAVVMNGLTPNSR
ncbi:Molybdenum transport ATP-binding protein ModC [Vibrio cholerae]|nr:Molybdenum transport ATP-binding protein ModC [Vibrio cholerae]